MNPDDLTHDELFALAVLLRHMIAADGDISEEEATELAEIGLEMDQEAFKRAWDKSGDNHMSSGQAVAVAASTAERVEARELIHTMLSDLAQADGLHTKEEELLVAVRAAFEL